MTTNSLQKAAITLLPLLGGVIVALIIIIIALSLEDQSIGDVWDALYSGAWSGPSNRARVLRNVMPLLLCSSGLLLTFTSGLWNIGIEGQLTMGAIGASLGALFVDAGGRAGQIAVELLLAMSAGAAWALLAGILKTRGGVNEIFRRRGPELHRGAVFVIFDRRPLGTRIWRHRQPHRRF